jgi:hypothetical protein
MGGMGSDCASATVAPKATTTAANVPTRLRNKMMVRAVFDHSKRERRVGRSAYHVNPSGPYESCPSTGALGREPRHQTHRW